MNLGCSPLSIQKVTVPPRLCIQSCLYLPVFSAPGKSGIFNPTTASPHALLLPTHLPTLCFSPWGVLTDRLPSGARHNPEAQVEKSPERRTLISKDAGSPVVSLHPAVCRWATPKAPQASSGIPSKTELTGPQQRLTCSCAFHGPLFSYSQINHLHQSLDFGSSWRQMKLYSNL